MVRRAQPCGKFMALNCIVSKEYLSYWSWYRCSVKCSSDVTCWLANWLAGIIIVRKRRCIQQTNKEAHRKGGNTSSTAVLMAKKRGGCIPAHPAPSGTRAQQLSRPCRHWSTYTIASRRFSLWLDSLWAWLDGWLTGCVYIVSGQHLESLPSLSLSIVLPTAGQHSRGMIYRHLNWPLYAPYSVPLIHSTNRLAVLWFIRRPQQQETGNAAPMYHPYI